MKRILIFGDSISEGMNDTEMGGWVNRLKTDYYRSDKEVWVGNCGIAGDTSENILKRFDAFFNAYIERGGFDAYVIFAVGINDTKLLHGEKKNQKIAIGSFKMNMEILIEKSKSISEIKKVYILGLTNVDETKTCPMEGKSTHIKNEEIQRYDEALEQLAKEKRVDYISLRNIFDEYDLEDGLHPNHYGHHKIYSIVKKHLLLHL